MPATTQTFPAWETLSDVFDSQDDMTDEQCEAVDQIHELLTGVLAIPGRGSAADQCEALYELIERHGVKVA